MASLFKPLIAVVTGASAGIGRATARELASRGYDVALLARNPARLEAAANEVRALGVRALPVVVDVSEARAVDAAAERIEADFGPIGIWINNAMATIFAPLQKISAEEFQRVTDVTYLGQVHGTVAALRHMQSRNCGTIVNIGSTLAYRGIPLQSAYCGAKYAVRGFTDALRAELIHGKSAVRLAMVHLPAVNTPQFDWALNKTERRSRPVPPVIQPEVAARAIADAALHPQGREFWVGMPTWKTILANKFAPGLLDWYLAKAGYSDQLTHEAPPADAPSNLFTSPDGDYRAHGRFNAQPPRVRYRPGDLRHRSAAALTLVGICAVIAALAGRRGSRGS